MPDFPFRARPPSKSLAVPARGFIGRLTTRSRCLAQPTSLPQDVPVDEEQIPGYDPEDFFRANPGEVLDRKYELKAKIGWGTTSTVWLAEDTRCWRRRRNRYVAIKIKNCGRRRTESIGREWDISQQIANIKSDHGGHFAVRTVLREFTIESPVGPHRCLVFEPMREPLWLFRRRFGADKVMQPFLPIFKTYLKIILEGLDYLHSQCHVIHTDLTLDNILVTVEDQQVIKRFIQTQASVPMSRKLVNGQAIYRSHNDFGSFDGKPALEKVYPRITSFGLAQRGDQPGLLVHPIQPDHCRAPEVLLGTGWSCAADIWNFGIMVWDLLAGRELFQTIRPRNNAYSARHHLAEMISILGPVPKTLVERERGMRRCSWSLEARNSEENQWCNTVDYFDGPFFSDDGEFLYQELIPSNRSLSDVPGCIVGEDTVRFLNFMRKMLCWLPEDRATAKELKEDPWLTFIAEKPRRFRDE